MTEEDRHNSEFVFEKSSIEICDAIAENYFENIKKSRQFPEYHSIQYVEEDSGDLLLVCVDGSFLFTPEELGSVMNIKAFKNGLRSDPQALQNRSNIREWETVSI